MCPMGLVSGQQMDADVDFYALWPEDADGTSERDESEDGAPFVAACDGRVHLHSGGHTTLRPCRWRCGMTGRLRKRRAVGGTG